MHDRKTSPHPLRVNLAQRIPTVGRPPSFSPGLLEMRMLARIDGRSTVADLARDLELAPAEAMSVLERLERIGAVRWLGLIELSAEELEEEGDPERITSPNLTFERPTWPSSPPAE